MRLYTKRYENYPLSMISRSLGNMKSSDISFINLTPFVISRKGEEPDFSEALIVRQDSTIEDVCDQIHRTLKETFKYALVWGASARHIPQRVGLGHMVADEDVVSIVAK